MVTYHLEDTDHLRTVALRVLLNQARFNLKPGLFIGCYICYLSLVQLPKTAIAVSDDIAVFSDIVPMI